MADHDQLPNIADSQRTPVVEQLLEQVEQLLEDIDRTSELLLPE